MKFTSGVFCALTFLLIWSPSQAQQLDQPIKQFIRYYQQSLSQLAEETDSSAFINLFESESSFISNAEIKRQVFNDVWLQTEQTYLSPAEYVHTFRSRYSSGVKVEVQMMKYELLKKQGDQNFIMVKVQKLQSPNWGGQAAEQIHKLDFMLSYNRSADSLNRFKIVQIRATGTYWKASRLQISLSGQYMHTKIKTGGYKIGDQPANQYGEWDDLGYFLPGAALEISYLTKKQILGFGIRLAYQPYKTQMSMDTMIQVPDLSANTITAAQMLKEEIDYRFLELPVFVKFLAPLSSSRQSHVYFNIGPVFSFAINGKSTTSGYLYNQAFEEKNTKNTQTARYFESESNETLQALNISGFAELGLSLPLVAERLYFHVSAYYQRGFKNLSGNTGEYILQETDGSLNPIMYSRNPVTTESAGFTAGLSVRTGKRALKK